MDVQLISDSSNILVAQWSQSLNEEEKGPEVAYLFLLVHQEKDKENLQNIQTSCSPFAEFQNAKVVSLGLRHE